MNASTRNEVSTLLLQVVALLNEDAPAKPAQKKPARKATPKKAPAKRTAQPKADLGRKGWNRACTGLARSMGQANGSSVYSQVVARWAEVTEARDAGLSPREALEVLGF